jgi:hypothetical protein
MHVRAASVGDCSYRYHKRISDSSISLVTKNYLIAMAKTAPVKKKGLSCKCSTAFCVY